MNDCEKKVLEALQNNNIEYSIDLVENYGAKELFASYYFLYACIYIKLQNFTNAWLWLWRGLEKFPEDNRLFLLMKKVSNYINMKSNLFNKNEIDLYDDVEELANYLPFNLEIFENTEDTSEFSVLQGTIEIANQMNTLSLGLKHNNIKSHTLNYYPYYLNYTSDFKWSLIGQRNTPILNNQLRKLAQHFIPNYDIFHFHWGTSFTLDGSDLPLVKGSGKGMVMQHWGSDVRLLSEAKKINPYALVKNQNEEQIKRNLERMGKQIKHCLVSDMELLQYVKDFYENVTIIPSMINLNHYNPPKSKISNKKLLIAHAPTSPYIKGTKYILKAIESLRLDYDFDFITVQGKKHEEAMKIYQKADLIIDQLHVGSYGLLAVETMAMEKPVICWISDYMKEKYPDDLPIIIANPNTIKDCLEYVLNNMDMLPSIGLNGRKYVETNHDFLNNSKKTISYYKEILKNEK